MPQDPGPTDSTKARLLQAAGDEFARVGFEPASVRSICENAEANVSAVKYHFGSKKQLYLAVWEAAAVQMTRAEPMPRLEDYDDATEALTEFIVWFMNLVLTERTSHPWAGQLLAHETVRPTPGALAVFVEHCAGPIKDEISRIVAAVVGKPPTTKTHHDLVFAVVALCVNAKHSRDILTMLGHPPPDTKAGINRMARVMADFAISGLLGFRSEED